MSKATYVCVLGDQIICIVNKHNYLGLMLTECHDYMEMVQNQYLHRRREVWVWLLTKTKRNG